MKGPVGTVHRNVEHGNARERGHSQVRQRVEVATTLVLLRLVALRTEPLECCRDEVRSQSPYAHTARDALRTGEARHAVLLPEWPSNTVGVDLRNDDLVLCVCKGVRELLIDGCKVLETAGVSPKKSELLCSSASTDLAVTAPRGKAK